MRDIIVIGAPIGGGAALAEVIGNLPSDFDASVFVVLHTTPDNPILLADVLNAPGRMRAAEALHGEPVARRRIYVAADGKHLLCAGDKVHLSANGERTSHRPSIDLLFSSAGESYKSRVIGVLLLHGREDGIAGLHAIRRRGGRTISHRNELMPEPPRDAESGEVLSDHHVELEAIAARVLACAQEANGSGGA
jgi:two-component system, chemotaxis family, protein-glutamate methylesterase/glutaminase